MRGRSGLRARLTIRSDTLQAILTFVTLQGQTELTQRLKQRHEQCSSFSQRVFDVRWIAAEVRSYNQAVLLHVAQAPHERTTADRKQAVQQFHRSLWTTQQLTHDQHRPLITEHLSRSSDWAAIEFASFHRGYGLR